MILDRLENAERYIPLHPGFAQAFDFLRRPDLSDLSDGRLTIDGERLYAIVARGQGQGRQKARLETHRRYIDIQYVVAGTELIGWRHAGTCRRGLGFDPAKDIGFHADLAESWVTVPAGHFALLFPEDAHAPLAGEEPVHKVVVKVAVRDSWLAGA